jgi:hypothetical protein
MVFDLHQPLHPIWCETDTYVYIAVGVLNATHGGGSWGAFARIVRTLRLGEQKSSRRELPAMAHQSSAQRC